MRWPIRIVIVGFLLTCGPFGVSAQDDARQAEPPQLDNLLDKPQSPAEWWRAVEFELNVGKHDLAANYLRGFLESNPTDEDLLAIEKAKGMTAFLRLRAVPVWSDDPKLQLEATKNAEEVIRRATEALQKSLSDPQRIARYVRGLKGTAEERAFAERELFRAGSAAMPQLVNALRADSDPDTRAVIVQALSRMRAETVGPLLAATATDDPVVKSLLLRALAGRSDLLTLPALPEVDPTPTLHFLAASPDEDAAVRRQATEMLARILGDSPTRLPPATRALTEAAWAFYRHARRFSNPSRVPAWQWENNQLKLTELNQSQGEEYFGLRYAGMALRLDAGFVPAQITFLSLAADKAIARSGWDKPLSEADPAVHDLLATAPADTLIYTLDQAVRDQSPRTAMAAADAIGARGDVRAAVSTTDRPAVLVRALEMADRRVQMAAARALVSMPGPARHQASARIVEVLRRFLSAETEVTAPRVPRVLVAHPNPEQAVVMAGIVQSAGYEAVIVTTGRELMRRLKAASDIDAVLLDAELWFLPLPDILGSIKSDVHTARLPVMVGQTPMPEELLPAVATELRLGRSTPRTLELRIDEKRQIEDERARLGRLIREYPGTYLLAVVSADEIRRVVAPQSAPVAGDTAALSPEERVRFARESIELFRKMANGEATGYDIRPAERPIRSALRIDELATAAVEITGQFSSRDAQSDLASVLTDDRRPEQLRGRAAEQLARHVARFGLMLTADQVRAVQNVLTPELPSGFRSKVATAVGAVTADPRTSGRRMTEFRPKFPTAIPGDN